MKTKKNKFITKGAILGFAVGLVLFVGGFLAYNYASSGKVAPTNCFASCRRCCDYAYNSCVGGCGGNNFCVRNCVTDCTNCYGNCQKQEGN
ncbi:MAG: hypothetical protein WC107_01100 [Patescibacteria group bacterium]